MINKKPYVKLYITKEDDKGHYWPYPEVEDFFGHSVNKEDIIWLTDKELEELEKDEIEKLNNYISQLERKEKNVRSSN